MGKTSLHKSTPALIAIIFRSDRRRVLQKAGIHAVARLEPRLINERSKLDRRNDPLQSLRSDRRSITLLTGGVSYSPWVRSA